MLRTRLPRRTLLAAAAAAAFTHQQSREKPPIYPQPDPEIVLVEQPSELERRIARVREAATARYSDAHARVQSAVSRWIGVEHAVENRVKSLIAPDEPLTPGILYVGIATLTGSVLTRTRPLPLRVLLPPTLFLLSSFQFLPKTTRNVSAYLGELEERYAPGVAEKHEVAKAHARMTAERVGEWTREGRESVRGGVVRGVEWVQDVTGLKVKETFGVGAGEQGKEVRRGKERVGRVVEEARRDVEATVEEAKAVTLEKAEEAKAAVEQKAEEVKRLV